MLLKSVLSRVDLARSSLQKHSVCYSRKDCSHHATRTYGIQLDMLPSLCVARKWAENIKEPCALFKVDSQGMCNLQSGLPGKYGFNCSSVHQYIQVKPVCLPVAHALKVWLTPICFRGGMQFACEMGHFCTLHTWKYM